MYQIIPPDRFKQFPWKNGKGTTTELAISERGSVSDFEWRLSIASVVKDGPFSDFSGYERSLILIEGGGIELQHDQNAINTLDNILEVAQFDGGSHTRARLISGPIKDFNLMTRTGAYEVAVNTYVDPQTIGPLHPGLGFAFCLSNTADLVSEKQNVIASLPPYHLLKLDQSMPQDLYIRGEQMIVIALIKI